MLFAVATVVVLAQTIKHHTWCVWALVVAGPCISFGAFYRNISYIADTFDRLMVFGNELGPGMADENLAKWMVVFIDLGAIFVMQAALITFSRLVAFLQPRDFALRKKLTVAHALLSLINFLVALAVFKPVQVKFCPFLELPLCGAFVYLHYAYEERFARWAEEKRTATTSRPLMNLFYATRRIAVILAIRAVVRALCTLTGQFHKEIFFNLLTNQGGLLLCFWTFCRNHPGWFLPREYTTLIYRAQANDYKSVPLEDIT